jgi:2-amino-4-hydroxy-6-hydroxymethyldihydropteridine diphosphokinase
VTTAVLALGSNEGDRFDHLRQAVEALAETLLVVSGVYESPPWGDTDQPDYLNAVALVADGVAPQVWLGRASELERRAGRVRDPQRRFGPRTLDVDVIAVWTDAGLPITSDDPAYTLPHPRAHLRAFVLRPWLDIAPYAKLPGYGPVQDLLRADPVAADLALLRPRLDLDLVG